MRCPKCQNQTIADSNAPIAKDLRFLLHQQLEDGASDEEILSFMVDRYGEFVRYRPDLDARTAVLGTGPQRSRCWHFSGCCCICAVDADQSPGLSPVPQN